MVCRKLRNKPGNDGLAICAKTRGGPSARSYKIGPLLCPSKQVNNRKAELRAYSPKYWFYAKNGSDGYTVSSRCSSELRLGGERLQSSEYVTRSDQQANDGKPNRIAESPQNVMASHGNTTFGFTWLYSYRTFLWLGAGKLKA